MFSYPIHLQLVHNTTHGLYYTWMAFIFLTDLAMLLREISGAKTISSNRIGLQEKKGSSLSMFQM